MPSPLNTTFNMLSLNQSAEATDLLAAAVEVPVEEIQTRAVNSLIKKNTLQAHSRVIKWWSKLLPASQVEVKKQKAKLHGTLQHCLMTNDRSLQTDALDVAVSTSDFLQIQTLLDVLQNKEHPLLNEIIHANRLLTDQFYEALLIHQNSDPSTAGYDPDLKGQHRLVLKQLSEIAKQIQRYENPEMIIESLLILGNPETPGAKEVLVDATSSIRKITTDILEHSTHPGVMQFLIDSLAIKSPSYKILEVIRRRSDPEFINYFLGTIPVKFTPTETHNYLEIDKINWLTAPYEELSLILPAHHLSLIRLLMAVRLPVDDQLYIQEWLIRNGSAEVRLAASEIISSMDQTTAESIVMDSLESEDPELQAWATGQLRTQATPEGFGKLIDRVDSDIPEVQQKAREELESFDIDLMIKMYDESSLKINRQAGKLLRKLDPEVTSKLSDRLHDPIGSKQIRAANAAFALGMHQDVYPAIVALLRDQDPLVRRTAAEILGDVPNRNVYDVLYRMRDDKSTRVREVVMKSLHQIQVAMQKQQNASPPKET